MYRIYSRISREILDKIWPKFYQFDLYTGLKKYLPKYTKTISCTFQILLFTRRKLWNFRILNTFCHIFFQFDLYATVSCNYLLFCLSSKTFEQERFSPHPSLLFYRRSPLSLIILEVSAK